MKKVFEKFRMYFEKYKIYGFKIFMTYLLGEIKRILWNQIIYKSYSLDREDIIIDKILGYKKKGFYVDVGAYDPRRVNNTKRFYDRGWFGINIEPSKENYNKFILHRKRDINLNLGIGNKNKQMKFYKFIPDTLSTFSIKEKSKYKKLGHNFSGTEFISVRKLSYILNKYCPKKKIDFLSIDTEGYDFEVLKSNGWKKFRPKVICIETANYEGFKLTEHSRTKAKVIDSFLTSIGYEILLDNQTNSIYQDMSSK